MGSHGGEVNVIGGGGGGHAGRTGGRQSGVYWAMDGAGSSGAYADRQGVSVGGVYGAGGGQEGGGHTVTGGGQLRGMEGGEQRDREGGELRVRGDVRVCAGSRIGEAALGTSTAVSTVAYLISLCGRVERRELEI